MIQGLAVIDDQALVEAAARSFLTALLLTGTELQAEEAVIEGIRRVDIYHATDEALLLATIEAAVSSQHGPLEHFRAEANSSTLKLPVELKRIWRLRPAIR